MRRILVTNDDGYFSPGIEALAAAMRPLGEVTIVAPQREASAVGHALTLRVPLRLERIAADVFAVDGTPTDCVNLAIHEVLSGRPDLVVSGINKGLNVGDDVTYSGTVAGALEGALLGYPAMAVSMAWTNGPWDFSEAASHATRLAEALLANPLTARSFLNVNVPQGAIRGVKVTVQAKRNHITKIDKREDPRGRDYFWIEEAMDDWQPHDRSDRQAVEDGYVSVTPLHPDLTDHGSRDHVEKLLRIVHSSGANAQR